ncbi:TPA: DNA translocase FtsK, partial [Providencia alcalifaciens]
MQLSHHNTLDSSYDPLTVKAIDYVILINRASPRRLQRHFRIGFHRAERIIHQIEYLGVITPLNQYDYREVLGYPTHHRSFDTSAFAAPIETAQTP